MKKRILTLLMAVALVLSISPAALAASSDDQVTSAKLGGVAIDLGTPVTPEETTALSDFTTVGSVTLNPTQANDAEFELTLADGLTDTGTLKVAKADTGDFAFGDGSSFGTLAAEDYADGDYVFFYVVDGEDDAHLYAIKVTVSNATGSSSVGGSGDTAYIDLEIYDVTLPTGNLLDFALDPQGLLGITGSEPVAMDDLVGGRIISNGVAKAFNNSAMDIKLSIELTGTGDATFLPYTTDDETTLAAIDADTNNNVLLYAVPSSVNIVDATTEYSAAHKGYVITKDGSTLDFVLPKAEYEVTNDGGTYTATPKEGTGHGTAIQLGGYVNSTANWTDYTGESAAKTVGLGAVFSYVKATDAESAQTPVAGIPGLISTTESLTLIVPPTVDEVTVAPDTVSVAKGATQDFTATVTGTNSPDQTVTWSVSGNSSSDTRFTDSTLTVAADETAEALTVTATSTVDNTKHGTATVTVAEPTATVDEVTVAPDTVSVAKGATQDFTATVTGTNNPDQTVTWSVSGNSSSDTKFTDGTLTVAAGETATTLTVTATSTVDNTKHGTATVTVTSPTLGFTDAGGTPTASKTYTYSKAAGTDVVAGFYFGGNTITSIKKSITTVATSNYTVNANNITMKSSYLSSLSNGAITLTIAMNSVSYTLNITITD